MSGPGKNRTMRIMKRRKDTHPFHERSARAIFSPLPSFEGRRSPLRTPLNGGVTFDS